MQAGIDLLAGVITLCDICRAALTIGKSAGIATYLFGFVDTERFENKRIKRSCVYCGALSISLFRRPDKSVEQ